MGRAATWAIATPHGLATERGAAVLSSGGTAADALIAANAVLGVVAPETCGLGGDLFALVWRPGNDRPEVLDAAGPAGAGADPDEPDLRGHVRVPPRHPAAVTVPGCVSGWTALHARYGRLPWESLLAPAAELAADGFPASAELARTVAADPEVCAAAGLLVDGRPPAPGHRLVRPELARTLRAVAGEGRSAVDSGPVAEAISAAVGGRIRPADLAAFEPAWVEPARLDVFGTTGWTVPPPSQGYLTLATLRIAELVADGAPVHVLVEAYRAAAWDRDDVLFDGADVAELLAEDRLAARAAAVDPERAGRWPVPSPVPGGTAFLAAIDAGGMGVALIQSNFAHTGAGLTAGGFLLHNRGAGFDLRPGHPNRLAPGRRPLHTLSPSLWTRGGELVALLGTRGGHQQPQILAQVAAALFRDGLAPEAAVAAPRWTLDLYGDEPVLDVESRMDPATVADLRRRSHLVRIGAPWEDQWGPVSLVSLAGGELSAVADPRVETTSAMVG